MPSRFVAGSCQAAALVWMSELAQLLRLKFFGAPYHLECPKVGLDRSQRRDASAPTRAPPWRMPSGRTLPSSDPESRHEPAEKMSRRAPAEQTMELRIAERAEAARTHRQQFLVGRTSSLYTGTRWISRRESSFKMAQWLGCLGARRERSLRWESSMIS